MNFKTINKSIIFFLIIIFKTEQETMPGPTTTKVVTKKFNVTKLDNETVKNCPLSFSINFCKKHRDLL